MLGAWWYPTLAWCCGPRQDCGGIGANTSDFTAAKSVSRFSTPASIPITLISKAAKLSQGSFVDGNDLDIRRSGTWHAHGHTIAGPKVSKIGRRYGVARRGHMSAKSSTILARPRGDILNGMNWAIGQSALRSQCQPAISSEIWTPSGEVGTAALKGCLIIAAPEASARTSGLSPRWARRPIRHQSLPWLLSLRLKVCFSCGGLIQWR